MFKLAGFLILPISCDINSKSYFDRKVEHRTVALKPAPLAMPPPLPETTIKTDSSIIRIKTWKDLNSIREFNELDSSDITYYTDRFFENSRIRETGMLDEFGSAGVWKYYRKNGNLYKEIDFETGKKTLLDGWTEPYETSFSTARNRGDSILAKHFGAKFVREHIQWSPGNSSYYTRKTSEHWFNIASEEPERFALRYLIKLDSIHRYWAMTIFLDRDGGIVTDETKGLMFCGKNCDFKINFNDAIRLSKNEGLRLTNKKSFNVSIQWVEESDNRNNKESGNYRVIVVELKGSEKYIARKVYYFYDAVAIDPWSGCVIEKFSFEICLDDQYID